MKTSIMKSVLQKFLLAALFLAATTLAMAAQENSGGTINSLSADPRQNLELTHSTGTETGQPNDVVAGSQGQENGLVPVTSNMQGSGSNGDLNPTGVNSNTTTTGAAAVSPATTKSATQAKPNAAASSSASKAAANPKK
jgi:hypothetical protein